LKYDANAVTPPMSRENEKIEIKDVPIRQNLKETVFFIPSVNTDPDGNYIIDFKMNEALTSWKLMLFAHTKELAYAFDSRIVRTQKDLMIQPNMPRFLRQGDTISLSARISNLSSNELKGEASIQLIDVNSGQDITKVFGSDNIVQFIVKGAQNTAVSWKIGVPENWISPLEYKVIARSGELTDGEGGVLPVLSDRMLVTETLPLPVRAGQTKTFTLKSLKENQSKTLQSFNYTLEFTSNPVWYAVKALPYLSEYPHECSEQIFSRIYANVLVSYVANKNPKYKENYDKWKTNGGLQSKLSTNQELKITLLEETPWVQNADSEEDQMKKMANLFDIMRIKDETASALHKLVERQMQDGGFSWFPGGRSDWYITQYIMEGFAHLNRLKIMPQDDQYKQLITKGMEFIDFKFLENYNELKRQVKEGKAKWEDDHLSQIVTHYLYTTSFYAEKKWDDELKTAKDYYLGQIVKYWNNKSVYDQGLMSLVLNRMKTKKEALSIVKSLSERAIFNEELGMYWKSDWGYYWYQMPVETQSLMIEVFDEVANDNKSVDELRVWLLKNKQTNDWKTTKATAEAIYALLLTGTDWVSETLDPEITLGNHKIDVAALPKEPGTGYFKTSYREKDISKDMATITVKNPNKQIAWGGVYWQYFEKLENINSFKETPLTIKKAFFKVENSDRGPIMKQVSDKNILEKGDKLRVRIEIKVDRDMEYVHLKDMRGSGFEPVNVLSSYKWQGGLGYYESTRDAATDFFISFLPKGTYVFEYDLRANATGSFSMGISTMQCMYAPEFSSHSKGERIRIN
ncbi:MAG TPA: alpha-2-macroglobulin family protein, partial [Saprospiraceae bacterium]|nr:alpha-2-macroglobulin family protein [Saprospiraceae bacterium]